MELPEKTAAIILAAGSGSRFQSGTHKLLSLLHGRPVFQWALETARTAGFDRTIVVTGAIRLPIYDPTVTVVHNPDFAQGQMSSLRKALDAARTFDVEAVVIGLGDQPFLTVDAWRQVGRSASPIAVATYGDRRGHPVRLHHSIWDLLDDEGDVGARNLMRNAPHLVSELACVGSPADIDTVEDLLLWNSSTNSSSTAP